MKCFTIDYIDDNNVCRQVKYCAFGTDETAKRVVTEKFRNDYTKLRTGIDPVDWVEETYNDILRATYPRVNETCAKKPLPPPSPPPAPVVNDVKTDDTGAAYSQSGFAIDIDDKFGILSELDLLLSSAHSDNQ